jgi:glycosyltransferase involved in cell wall biosynthesis
MQPLVSVILTAYNAEKYIGYAIDSILGQTLSNFELFIVDDGSKDSTKAIIKTFSDERVVSIFNKTNRGQSYSRNLAVANARGKYIAIMDADDIAYPTRLQKQVVFMEENPDVGLCATWAHLIDEVGSVTGIKKGPVSDVEIKLRLLFYCPVIHPSVLWRKSVFDHLGLQYDEYYVYAQDFDLWTRAMAKGVIFHILQEPLLYFRFKHAGSISGKKTDLQNRYAGEIIKRNFRELIGTEYHANMGLWQQRALFRKIINAAFLSGQRNEKIQYFRKKLFENSKLPYRLITFLRELAIKG